MHVLCCGIGVRAGEQDADARKAAVETKASCLLDAIEHLDPDADTGSSTHDPEAHFSAPWFIHSSVMSREEIEAAVCHTRNHRRTHIRRPCATHETMLVTFSCAPVRMATVLWLSSMITAGPWKFR